MKKMLKVTSSLLTLLMIGIMICLAIVVISSKASGGEPAIFGYQLKTVLSGSMEPTFQTGSIIAIKPTKEGMTYENGDVITFRAEDDKVITHRIIDTNKVDGKSIYTTKGDHNESADVDPVLSQNVIGKYVDFTIPYVGYLLSYASSKAGAALLLVVPGIILFLYSIVSIFNTIREIDGKKESPSV
ncbi:signal peptidase I [Halobacillus shinanisalinarum]|uniref:Signal peptidase I n=1 Tax=Halobacillus shinanisalinarum TaxID=2932258 RepID=A0ABY4H5N2_9BACI|nr:signal peptidase I [Halobacillus shinanisalinarum]UOQ95626.1 signal peptidase I [Halobacillus shinanisalinarum]